MKDRAGAYQRARKTQDRALVLVLIGLALLMPPVAGVFHVEDKWFWIPGTLVYLFVVWAALILAAARLSKSLQADEDSEEDRDR